MNRLLECECGNSCFLFDDHHDETYCPSCGAVVGRNNVMFSSWLAEQD